MVFVFRRQEGVWIVSPMPCDRRALGAAVELAGAQDAQRRGSIGPPLRRPFSRYRTGCCPPWLAARTRG